MLFIFRARDCFDINLRRFVMQHAWNGKPERPETVCDGQPFEFCDFGCFSLTRSQQVSTLCDTFSYLVESSRESYVVRAREGALEFTRSFSQGKGVIASSTGLLLKTLGLNVTAIKIDPYMNIDAGTMAPTEHGQLHYFISQPETEPRAGEVFVLDDGGEVDLDLGNYERYLNVTLGRENNITTGKIYQQVIEREVSGALPGRAGLCLSTLANSVEEITWARRCRSFLTLRMRFKIGLNGSLKCPSTALESLLMSVSSR